MVRPLIMSTNSYTSKNTTAHAHVTPDPQVKTNTQAFIALPACISSPLSLYLDPLPAALGFLQRAIATGALHLVLFHCVTLSAS